MIFKQLITALCRRFPAVFVLLLPLLGGSLTARACTSAIVGAGAAGGHTLLWKHRDSGFKDNFIARVAATDSTMAFVGLFNGGDTQLREVWAGFNEAGFAVMNTASYNLAPDTASVADREGMVMTRALRVCRTVEDFLRVLDAEMANGRTAGVQANFGVTDAAGNGAYVETSDHSYRVYPLADSPQGWMVRSNYSYSGSSEGRLGEVRHDNATTLITRHLSSSPAAYLRPEDFTENFSRSYYHARSNREELTASPLPSTLTDRGEYISRRSSSASVVIDRTPGGHTVMWVALGFPAGSVTMPVTLDSIPTPLLASPSTGRSPLCDEANLRRAKAFPRKAEGKTWVVNAPYLRRLIPDLRRRSLANYRAFRASHPAF